MLYEKYRPIFFNQILGQNLTPTILKEQVKQGKIAHSYLFSGNRGSGKTSAARVLAKAINCKNNTNGEPCGVCENCKSIDAKTFIDLTEIDAASNNGVDNIRTIIDDFKYPPQYGQYKVYIIDEAHMLSNAASNAFLKLLEEPPRYAVFILATTDPQKLPITILSRCQRFEFKRIDKSILKAQIEFVAKNEGKHIEPLAAELLSKLADGAMRDALSLLEQTFTLGQNIMYQDMVELFGISTNKSIVAILKNIITKNTLDALTCLNNMFNDGKDIYSILKQLLKINRDLLIFTTGIVTKDLIECSDVYNDLEQVSKLTTSEKILYYISTLQSIENDVKVTSNGKIYLESAIIKMCRQNLNLESKIKNIESKLDTILSNHTSKSNITTTQSTSQCTISNSCNDSNVSNNYTFSEDNNFPFQEEVVNCCINSSKNDNKLNLAKEQVISKLETQKIYDVANAIKSSDIGINSNCLSISCSCENISLLERYSHQLIKGFNKYLNSDDLSIKIYSI